MTFPRTSRYLSFLSIAGLALTTVTALGILGCSGGGSGDSSTGGTGGTGGSGAGTGGASSGAIETTGTSMSGSTSSSSNTSASTASSSSTSGSGGGSATGQCPADATFCSGFEESAIPAGATYHPGYQAKDWANYIAFDGAVTHAGTHALKVKPGAGGYDWRMLGVPAPGPTFWVRLYMRSDVDIGQAEHNAYFQAMTGDGEPNTGDNVEVAEQYCQVVLNLHDDVVLSKGGSTACGSGGVLLPKNTWHCMEAYFDGTKGVVQVYANGNTIIDKAGWTKLTYKTFSFGFLSFHGPARTMWYDDVAVAPERIGCGP